jgi:deoxyribonuclease-4
MLLGIHVSIAGHIYDSIDRAQRLGCTAMQIFPRDPRQWRKTLIPPADIAEFRKRRQRSQVRRIFVHIPYLINLASPQNILYKGSIKACLEDLKEADALGAEYLVIHMGSHKESGEEKGLRRITDALNKVLNKTRGLSAQILLENTSGSGSWLGYTFAHQRWIIARIEQKDRIGICFDTCHGYAAGYDIARAEGYVKTMAELDAMVGLEKLKLVHLNDTRDKLGSFRDRHEHIGKGRIGLEGFKRIVNDPRLKEASFILETPKDSLTADKRNLATVRKLIGKQPWHTRS